MKNTMKQINLYMLPKKYLYIYVCVYNWLNKKQKTILKIFAKKLKITTNGQLLKIYIKNN